MAQIGFSKGLYANLPSTRNANTLYFTTDTHQLYLGMDEYTKSTKLLNAVPTEATEGEVGCLYAYNSNLYLCSAKSGSTYTWIRVANINDNQGTVESIEVGEGLTTVSGSTSVTTTDTIKHAVPAGATVVENEVAGDANLAFGSTFAVQGVATDKFGHVIGSTATTFTLPTETAVTVEDATGTPETLTNGSTFAVVTGVESGVADQAIKQTTTVFTLPAATVDTTYSFATSTTTDGAITVTPSTGSAYDVVIKGYDELAKKTDITAVFKFKGTVADVASLPTTGDVGDVYHVTAANAEYVCIQASTTDPVAAAVWEELGSEIDLSAYALSEDVIQRVTGAEGEVPKLKADGTLESTGFTLGTSVPATAVFTDTTYSPVAASTAADPGLMTGADKVKLDGIEDDAQVNVLEGIKVNGTTLAIDADKTIDIGSLFDWTEF